MRLLITLTFPMLRFSKTRWILSLLLCVALTKNWRLYVPLSVNLNVVYYSFSFPAPPKVRQHTVRHLKHPIRRMGNGGVVGNHDDRLLILPGRLLQ